MLAYCCVIIGASEDGRAVVMFFSFIWYSGILDNRLMLPKAHVILGLSKNTAHDPISPCYRFCCLPPTCSRVGRAYFFSQHEQK